MKEIRHKCLEALRVLLWWHDAHLLTQALYFTLDKVLALLQQRKLNQVINDAEKINFRPVARPKRVFAPEELRLDQARGAVARARGRR